MTDAEHEFALTVAAGCYDSDMALRGACNAFRFRYGYNAATLGFDQERAHELCEMIVGLIIDEALALRSAAARGVQ